jgi:hypothetical protein
MLLQEITLERQIDFHPFITRNFFPRPDNGFGRISEPLSIFRGGLEFAQD